jgi:hypothetical protein
MQQNPMVNVNVQTLLPKEVLILENVANLERMPPTGTTVVLGALNIHDGSGSPLRVLALVDLNCGTWGASSGGATQHMRGTSFTAAAALFFSSMTLAAMSILLSW